MLIVLVGHWLDHVLADVRDDVPDLTLNRYGVV